jgi:hypothetical protein
MVLLQSVLDAVWMGHRIEVKADQAQMDQIAILAKVSRHRWERLEE